MNIKKKIIIYSLLAIFVLFVVPFVSDVVMLPWPVAIAVYWYMTSLLLVGLFQIVVMCLAIPLVFWAAHKGISLVNRRRTPK